MPPVPAAVTAKMNDEGMPALGEVDGGVITSVGAAFTVTVTEPDA